MNDFQAVASVTREALDIENFLKALALQGVMLWAEGDKLRYRGAKEVLTPACLAQLKAHKTALLAFLQTEGILAPLSYGQQALWFVQQSDPESAAYNIPAPIRLHTSQLDEAKLQASLAAVVARHPLLRTTFTTHEGKPLQKILPTAPLDWTVIDATAWDAATLLDQVHLHAQRPFALENAPALRVLLFRRLNEPSVLLLCVHHLICDDWSAQVILEELKAFYTQPAPVALLPLARQYTDYIYWQTELLSQEGSQLAEYWQKQLAAPPVLHLPTDYPRPPLLKLRGATYPFQLMPELAQQLKALARAEGVTLYTLLLSAFAVLLYRYTGQDDLLIGSPTSASRSQQEFARTVGYFVNPIVLRANAAGNPSFKTFLHQLRQTVLEGLAHQAYPFPLLVKQIQPARDASRSPLFQTMFVFQNLHLEKTTASASAAAIEFEVFETPQMEGQVDLILVMEEATDGALVGAFKYHTDLFQATTIARLIGHWQTLLTGIVTAHPLGVNTPIANLPLLTPAEQQQLLVEWNATGRAFPADLCFHQLFERQVEQTPDAPAVVFVEQAPEGNDPDQALVSNSQSLSYRNLNAHANQLAQQLRTLGVGGALGAEVIVGVYAERSLELSVALLGILKAGGAYLPLDPAYPPDRLDFMVQDAQVSVIVTQPHLVERLPAAARQSQIVCLDPTWHTLEGYSIANPLWAVTPERLAYVIYTSGSTGKPKGVLVEHRGLTNLALAQSRVFGVQPASRVLQMASLNFDASISEIAMALCCGAALYLARQSALLPGPSLTHLLQAQAITHVTLTPSALAVLAADAFPQLETLIVAGEACSADLVKRWAKGRRFFNAYGPTENTVCATIMACTGTPYAEGEQAPPIGRPMDNVQVYVLDQQRQPVPIGVPGELYIGGVGVARGYLNRPELTAERFIDVCVGLADFGSGADEVMAHRASKIENQKLYKTGDLVRYLPDGNLEFLGRIDHQMKVRGYRIELGEIEAQVKAHPGVQDAVVVVQGEGAASRLVAFWVPNPATTVTADELRQHLAARLPEYMVPALWTTLAQLPLTPNGKVDRRALANHTPKLEGEPKANFVSPRNKSEEALATLWAEVLQLSTVGVQDDFFALGGHSLLAVRLLSRIEQQYGRRVPMANFLQGATIEQMATTLAQAGQELAKPGAWSPVVAIQPATPAPTAPPLFCIHPVGGNILCYRELAKALGPAQPVYGIQAFGLENGQTPLTSIEAMAAHYCEAIRQVQPHGPYYLAGWSLGGVIAFEMAQQWTAQGETVALVALIDSYAYTDEAARQSLQQEVQDETTLWAYFQEDLQRLTAGQSHTSAADEASLQTWWQLFRANTLALAHYVPAAYRQPLLLFLADAADEHGWRTVANGGLSLCQIGGNHYTILQAPQVQTLAAQLSTYLYMEREMQHGQGSLV